MNDDVTLTEQDGNFNEFSPESLLKKEKELDELVRSILQIAKNSAGDAIGLLALLRVLESLHREIREGLFQEALPSNRQALYSLLKDIEATGGWPYIYRMRLQDFMRNLNSEDAPSES